MAERATASSKKAPRSPSGKAAARKTAAAKPKTAAKAGTAKAKPTEALDKAMARLEGEVATLRQERDALASDLAAARERIAALESTHEQAINRIDWVIDSLHNVMNEKS